MFNIISSLLLISGGITIIFLGIYFPPKRIIEMYKDKNTLERHLKSQRLLDLITGFCFFILGVLSIKNILTGVQVGFLASLNYFLGRIAETIINRKHKAID